MRVMPNDVAPRLLEKGWERSTGRGPFDVDSVTCLGSCRGLSTPSIDLEHALRSATSLLTCHEDRKTFWRQGKLLKWAQLVATYTRQHIAHTLRDEPWTLSWHPSLRFGRIFSDWKASHGPALL